MYTENHPSSLMQFNGNPTFFLAYSLFSGTVKHEDEASRQFNPFAQMIVLRTTIWLIKWIAKSTCGALSASSRFSRGSESKIWPKMSTATKRFKAFNQWMIGRWNQLLHKSTSRGEFQLVSTFELFPVLLLSFTLCVCTRYVFVPFPWHKIVFHIQYWIPSFSWALTWFPGKHSGKGIYKLCFTYFRDTCGWTKNNMLTKLHLELS